MSTNEFSVPLLKKVLDEMFESNGLFDLKQDLTEIKELKKDIAELKSSLDFADKEWKEVKKCAEDSKKEVEKLKQSVKELKSELLVEKATRIELEKKQNQKVLLIRGIAEPKNEESEEECIFSTLEAIGAYIDIELLPSDIDQCYRLGKRPLPKNQHSEHTPRPVFMQFIRTRDKNNIWSQRRLLKGSSIVLKEFLPKEIEQNIHELIPIYKEARAQNLKVSLIQDRLFIENQKYTVNNIHALPESLRVEKIATKITENEIYFWGQRSPFSNFYTEGSEFEIENISYCCMEQYYSAEKAKFFNDESAKHKIMASNNPLTHKRTKIAGYRSETWNTVATDIMRKGLHAKFTQNPALKKILLDTKNKTLVETSPHDEHWGIGMSSNDPKIKDKESWGKNLLGKLLMELRDSLK